MLCFVFALSGADGCAVISELIAQRRDESGFLPGMGTSFVAFVSLKLVTSHTRARCVDRKHFLTL